MTRLTVKLDMPGALYSELQEVSRISGCRPEVYVAECVEAALATRVLGRITEPGRISSPRVPTGEE